MTRQFPLLGAVIAWAVVGLTGCQPQQPFYFFEDGDLSHYLDVATEIEYPDVEEHTLAEVDAAARPFSLDNPEPDQIWELSLEEAIRFTLANSKVMRSIGGQVLGPPDFLLRNPQLVDTVYDPALTESNPRFGVEAALSAFDAQFTSSVFWEKFDTPRNTTFNFIGTSRDTGTFQAQIAKTAATGATWSIAHNVLYEQSDSPIRRYASDWNINLAAEMRQPLMRGAGVQFNRIAGPGAIPGFNNGVMIARINTDIALADFQIAVRNLLSDVEIAYWELYYAYRTLDAMKAGRDAGLRSWQETKAMEEAGHERGAAHLEAQARAQYFLFRSAVEQALNNLYAAESKLRYLMGLAATDGRLIRPKDEPNTAKVAFDWHESLAETLCRNEELRRQKWSVKQRELELVAAKNYLLPQLDAVAAYRWLGLGDKLIDPTGGTDDPRVFGSNAYQSMTGGKFQEWQLGLELNIPLGFRKEMAGVRYAQLNLARERAKLQESELEASHQLAYAIREMEANFVRSQTNYNRRLAAQDELETIEHLKRAGMRGWTLSDVLDAQRRLAEAESDYYRTLVDYNQSIAEVHLRKGSLLEYNGVQLSEGPWPGKAYFDAHRRARARDASMYLDYGFTRPKVVSRGPIEQRAGRGPMLIDGGIETVVPGEGILEVVPAPEPEPVVPQPQAEGDDGPQAGGPTLDSPVAAEAPDGEDPRQAGGSTGPEAAVDRQGEAGRNTAGEWSAVKRAGYQQPATEAQRRPANSAAADRPAPKRPTRTWSRAKGSGSQNEPVADSPTPSADRAASVWKGVQR